MTRRKSVVGRPLIDQAQHRDLMQASNSLMQHDEFEMPQSNSSTTGKVPDTLDEMYCKVH